MDLQIRVFSDGFQGQVEQLIRSIQLNEFDITAEMFPQPELKKIPEIYQVKNGNFWVVVLDDDVIGTVALIDLGGNNAELAKMFVASEYRGHPARLAQKLLAEVLQWTRRHGFTNIYLETTFEPCAAHRFYEKNGFLTVSKNLVPPSFKTCGLNARFYHRAV